jgi:hypothetical protein
VLLLMPVGFSILALQAVSELIKRVAFLTGHRSEPFSATEEDKLQEQKLAEELAEEAARREAQQALAGKTN